MTMTGRAVRVGARGITAVLLTVTAALMAAASAAAEPPSDLAGEVTDHAGVLTDADLVRITTALDDLADTTEHQLFVVYVNSFDGLDPADWADETAAASGLGRNDILLAVAVTDRRYQVSVDMGSALSDDQLAEVESADIEPALRTDDWAGAAIAAAAGYRDAAQGRAGQLAPVAGAGGSGGADDGGGADDATVLGYLGGVIGVTLAATALFMVGSRSVRRRRQAAAIRAELAELDSRASRALLAVDEAIQASAQEVGFAEAQFGADATATFGQVLSDARTSMAKAFTARQQLDDAEPETDEQRRELLAAILSRCEQVDAALDAQTAAFDQLRDLHARAPQVLIEADRAADAAATRIAGVAATLAELTSRYAPSAVAAVAGNVAAAADLTEQARAAAARGTSTLGTDRSASVACAHEANDAVAQAVALLDAVLSTAHELAEAPARIAAAATDLDADVVDARRLAPGDATVTAAADVARAALTHAGTPASTADPLEALGRLRSAEGDLDRALAPLRDAEEALARARARLPQALTDVRSQILTVTDLIAGSRSTIGTTARTRLAEAQRHADAASGQAVADPVAALRSADTAAELLADARRCADRDVDAERDLQRQQSSSGGWGTGSTRTGGGFGGSGGSGGWFGGSGGGFSGGTSRRSSSSRSSRRSSGSSSSRRSSSSGRSSGRRGGGGRF